MTDEQHIIVRDRREKHQFSIHNRVIDEWLPIIGRTGYTLYSLYVRMANKADERSWPGYTLISQHLHVGRSSVSDYNQLLEWCGLIHVQPGDSKRPNEYYILDIPPVTPETLETVRQIVEASEKGGKFKQTVLKRLENWQPIQALWGRRGRAKPIIVHPNQLDLPLDTGSPVAEQGSPVAEQGSPVAEQGSPVAEQGSPVAEQGVRPQDSNNPKQQSKETIQNNNPKQQSTTTTPAPTRQDDPTPTHQVNVVGLVDLLSDFGIQDPMRLKIADNGTEVTAAQAWIWYAQTQEGLRDKPAFVVSQLYPKVIAPPGELLDLAHVVQQLTEEDLEILHSYASDRKWHDKNVWRSLLFGEDRDERLARLFTVDSLELWYTVCCAEPETSTNRRTSKAEREQYEV